MRFSKGYCKTKTKGITLANYYKGHVNTVNQSKLKEIAVVESVVKYCFVFKGIQWRQKGQYNGELNILPHLCVKPLINCINSYYL